MGRPLTIPQSAQVADSPNSTRGFKVKHLQILAQQSIIQSMPKPLADNSTFSSRSSFVAKLRVTLAVQNAQAIGSATLGLSVHLELPEDRIDPLHQGRKSNAAVLLFHHTELRRQRDKVSFEFRPVKPNRPFRYDAARPHHVR
jgi:hypothetical protein